MNDFLLYHNLCNLYSQTELYAGERELFCELKNLVEQFSSKTYRVAVIGEFKRGKSSLVNALLGTQILPTDILPTTAVINKIVYSLDQKIVIYFKNGEVKESTIDSLADYATKLDKGKEEFAETIREIVVHYPSVLGQNHIELIDTPGLNDNESMTETTLNVLGSIDTAIVVISATMPLSMTEQNLICELIKQADIYNLAFVVTFIDRVSDEEDEQDRVVDLIRNRLKEDTLEHFCETVEEANLTEKAKRILSQPNVYAVSSKQAITGFIKGKNDLIEKSRFPRFKYNLSALLTANQEKDRLLKIQRITSELEEQLPEWIEAHLHCGEESVREMQERSEELRELHRCSLAYLNEKLLHLDDEVKKAGDRIISELTNGTDIEKYLARLFIARLSSIRRSQYSEAVLCDELRQACAEANQFMGAVIDKLTAMIDSLSKDAFEEISGYYDEKLGDSDERPMTVFRTDTENHDIAFGLSEENIVGRMGNLFDECMPHVYHTIRASLDKLYEELEYYLASHRLSMIGYHKEIKVIIENTANELAEAADIKKSELQADRCVAENDKAKIIKTIQQINDIMS